MEKNICYLKSLVILHLIILISIKVTKIRLIGTIAAFDIDIDESKGYLNTAGKHLKEKALENGVEKQVYFFTLFLMISGWFWEGF